MGLRTPDPGSAANTSPSAVTVLVGRSRERAASAAALAQKRRVRARGLGPSDVTLAERDQYPDRKPGVDEGKPDQALSRPLPGRGEKPSRVQTRSEVTRSWSPLAWSSERQDQGENG